MAASWTDDGEAWEARARLGRESSNAGVTGLGGNNGEKNMAIPIEHEDKEELAKWGMGLETLLEHCIFCDKPTPYWHAKTNNPVCPKCSKTHKVGDIPKRSNAVVQASGALTLNQGTVACSASPATES